MHVNSTPDNPGDYLKLLDQTVFADSKITREAIALSETGQFNEAVNRVMQILVVRNIEIVYVPVYEDKNGTIWNDGSGKMILHLRNLSSCERIRS